MRNGFFIMTNNNRTNYTYGQPSLLIKQAVSNSYYAWNGQKTQPLTAIIYGERKKLKGMFIPNIFFGRTKADQSPAQYRIFSSKKKENWKNIDVKIKMLVSACFIDYKTVSKLGYVLDKPVAKKVKSDIDSIIFREIDTHDMAAYKKLWDCKFEEIINKVFENIEKNWNNGELNNEIKKLFTKSYVYGQRKTANKWMDNKDEEEIAKYLFENGFTALEKKHVSALKHRHISVKKVTEKLNYFMNAEEISEDTTKKVIAARINKWFFTKDNQVKNNILYYIANANNMDKNHYISLMETVYGYDDQWRRGIAGLKFTPEIKAKYDLYVKGWRYTNS